MKTPALGITTVCALALAAGFPSLQADTFGGGANTFTIDFVTIGNPGNPMDTGTTGLYSSPYGSVGYTFQMGKFEISGDMIDKANTVGGLLLTKDVGTANQPATGVNWNEAARFVNWLNVSSGYSPAYQFALQPTSPGYTGNENLVLWTVGDGSAFNASNPYRNANAHYFLPSEDEWYKAAYYSGSGTTYYDYATGSDTIPTGVASGTLAGTAVYHGASGTQADPADITQAGGLSHYGTMGQNGNAAEWTESAFAAPNDDPNEGRAIRGGNWTQSEGLLRSSNRTNSFSPSGSSSGTGFRVASVPEPSTVMLILSAAGFSLLKRRRGAN
jgi:sulfatase modifying factor 1